MGVPNALNWRVPEFPRDFHARSVRMAKKLTKKQVEHLQERLMKERERALRSLGQYDELAKESA
jgi:hypothetical protein